MNWEAPQLDAFALRKGIEFQLPERSEPYEWESIYLEYPRRWAMAAGLHDLSMVLLPEGVLEVRIWENFNPHTRYRGAIIQKRGASFYGADLFFSEVEPDACSGWAVGVVPCDGWEAVWSALTSDGLLELPDASELLGEHILEDGMGLVVEIQDQGRYRTYHYNDPDFQTWPEAQRVRKIIDTVRRRVRCDQYRQALSGTMGVGRVPNASDFGRLVTLSAPPLKHVEKSETQSIDEAVQVGGFTPSQRNLSSSVPSPDLLPKSGRRN